MVTRTFVTSASLLTLMSCTVVGPDYIPPNIDIASTFVEPNGGETGNTARQEWWRAINDEALNSLVVRGLGQNLTIQTSLERIRQAELQLETTGLPSQLSGAVSAQVLANGGEGVSSGTDGEGVVSAGYIIDLFGGNLRTQQEAAANLQAARFDLGTARLAYLASIIGNYVDARYFQETLALTRQTIASAQRTVDLVRRQRDLGEATDLAVAQAEAELSTARSALPSLEAGFYAANYRIATLLAEPAAPLLAQMQHGAPQPVPSRDVGIGIPANLLRNRPDVAAAERRYAAAIAGVGIAQANLYPSVTLNGNVAVGSPDSWSFGPSVSLPILGRGILHSRRGAAASRAAQAELDWRSSVLIAVEDVQIAQATYLRSCREVDALRRAVASNNRALNLSRAAFEGGGTSVLDLLDAERSTSRARISLATAARERMAAWVTLQIATGSGWAAGPVRTAAEDG